jgi:ABC-type transport system involved in multi-copper enzyme maturation permease subunit
MLLFGPVFWHDLRRMSRRQRYRWLCCLLALGMLVVLYVIFKQQMAQMELERSDLPTSRFDVVNNGRPNQYYGRRRWTYREVPIDNRELLERQKEIYQHRLVRTGEDFFLVFMVTQWVVLLCLTPAVVAGAIAEEKEKRTIDYLFTTHLKPREIVVGKMLSRMWVLLMLLLAGVPVMCIAFSLGGIVPDLLWGSYAATVTMMLSLASVSILHSVFARKVRQAILNSYLTFGGYFLGWGILEFVYQLMRSGTDSYKAAQLMRDFIQVYNTGNPFVTAFDLIEHFHWAGTLGGRSMELLAQFILFHGVVIAVCLSVAVFRMRAACFERGPGRTKKGAAAALPPVPAVAPKPPPRSRAKPPVGNMPMFWKECHTERTFKLGPLGKGILVVVTLALGAPAFVYFLPVSILSLAIGMDSHFTGIARDANVYLRWTGAILVTWIILSMSVRAATCISSERERQTWESLRATPLPLRRILWAKWWGCWWSVRWMLVLLVAMCGSVALAGGMHWLCIPALLAQLFAWGSFYSALGLWLSARCKSPVTAMALTIFMLVACSGLPWLAYLWDTKERRDPAPFHQWLERVSPSYGIQELCLTKADISWMPRYVWESNRVQTYYTYDATGYSPRGDKRERHLEGLADMTVASGFPLILFASGFGWLAYLRLRREGGR